MFFASLLRLRRRGTGHVVKYLEGVPTPTKLIDHLAGADLHASSELPFFSTVPRYVDTVREQRLSRLFFHHVLYPAGGARLPYQVVVVRGGRAVRAAVPRLLPSGVDKSGGPQRSPLPFGSSPTASTFAPIACRSNPLAVSPSQLHMTAATAAAQCVGPHEAVPAAAAWARVDPARQPFFSSRPTQKRGRGGTASNSVDGAGSASRGVYDNALEPLRGVVEHYWNEEIKASNALSVAPPATAVSAAVQASVARKVRDLLVSPTGGTLWMASEDLRNLPNVTSNGRDAQERHPGGASDPLNNILNNLRQSVASQIVDNSASRAAGTMKFVSVHTFAYMQTYLPPSAMVLLPNEPASDGNLRTSTGGVLCRIAGGLEPVVPFAVGRPITTRIPAVAASSPPRFPHGEPYAHITCVTRLNVCITVAPSKAASSNLPGLKDTHSDATGGTFKSSGATLNSPDFQEPWRLGGVELDFATPAHARTLAERHPTKSFLTRSAPAPPSTGQCGLGVPTTPPSTAKNRFVLGRVDAETYLIPQRELLLTLHVPTYTEEMCAAQNEERLRRQVRSGRAGVSSAMAWPTDQTRLTSSRRAFGQLANAQSANETGARHSQTSSKSPVPPSASSELASHTSYEVRALPGDVIYIPRGWGYDVQRILGTAIALSGAGAGREEVNLHSNHELVARKDYGCDSRASVTLPQRIVSETTHASPVKTAEEALRLTSVEVDAVCLNYLPYPELTEAQAATYVAANYVRDGVNAFYEKGGNEVYRHYL